MSEGFKPEGYASVSPYLIVEDAQPVIEFLHATFDASEGRRYEDADGNVLHVETIIDDSVVMMGEANEEFPATTSMVHVYVPDVDETVERAIDAGGEVIEEPKEQEGDPDRRGMVRGPAENRWVISTQVE